VKEDTNSMIGNCTQNYECHRGTCYESHCFCEPFIAGDYCTIPYQQEIGVGFLVFRFGFMILYLGITGFICTVIYKISQENKKVEPNTGKERNKITTLRGICICVTLGNPLLRFLYFATDPMGQNQDIPLALLNLFYGFGFYFMLMAYLLIVLYWAAKYHHMLPGNPTKIFVTKTKYVFIGIASTLFVITFLRELIYGIGIMNYDQNSSLGTVFEVYLAVILLLISVGMSIYGTLLYLRLRNTSSDFGSYNNMTKIAKKNKIVLIISATFLFGLIVEVFVLVGKLNNYPKPAIIGLSVSLLVELTIDMEMVYLMRPRTKSSPSPSTSTSTPPSTPRSALYF